MLNLIKILALPTLLIVVLSIGVYQSQSRLAENLLRTEQREHQLQQKRAQEILDRWLAKLHALQKVTRTPEIEDIVMQGRHELLLTSLLAWKQALDIPIVALYMRENNTLHIAGEKTPRNDFGGLNQWLTEQLSTPRARVQESLQLFRGEPTFLVSFPIIIAGEPRLLFIAGQPIDKNMLDRLAAQLGLPVKLSKSTSADQIAGHPMPEGKWIALTLPKTLQASGYELSIQLPPASEIRSSQHWAMWTTGIVIVAGLLLLGWLVHLDSLRARRQTQFVEAIMAKDKAKLCTLPEPWKQAGETLLETLRELQSMTEQQHVELEKLREKQHKLKHQYEHLLKKYHALENQPKTRSSFLSRMGDEITTPMNSVTSMLKLLQEFKLPPEPTEILDIANRSHQVLASNLENLLDFHKLDAGLLKLIPADFEIKVMVQEVIDELAPHAQAKGLELEWNINERVPLTCHSDRQRIRQVLYNLVGNAIRFTKTGKVSVFVDLLYEKGHQLVRFTVVDTGIGIPEEAQKTLFDSLAERSRLTNSSFAGRLKLIVCRQLVTLLGGQIGVKSEVGKGSRFWFTIRYYPPKSTT